MSTVGLGRRLFRYPYILSARILSDASLYTKRQSSTCNPTIKSD